MYIQTYTFNIISKFQSEIMIYFPISIFKNFILIKKIIKMTGSCDSSFVFRNLSISDMVLSTTLNYSQRWPSEHIQISSRRQKKIS